MNSCYPWNSTITDCIVIHGLTIHVLTYIKVYIQFLSILHTDMTQVVEILSHLRQELVYSTWSISWALMSWRRKEPGHQQPWYWLCWTGKIRFPHVKGQLPFEQKYLAFLADVTDHYPLPRVRMMNVNEFYLYMKIISCKSNGCSRLFSPMSCFYLRNQLCFPRLLTAK